MAVARPAPTVGRLVPVALSARRSALIAAALVVCGTALLLVVFDGDRMYPDTLMNLYAGRYVWQHGLPRHDPFTVAGHGRPWIDTQWLANLAFYGAERVGGLWLVGKLSLAACAAAYLLLSRLARRLGGSLVLQALGPLAALATALPVLFPRAQNLALPLFPLLLWLLLRAEGAARPTPRAVCGTLVAVLALLVLWGNLHGSSAMAVALTTALALVRGCLAARGRLLHRPSLALWGGLALLAPLTLLATPYGLATFGEYRAVLGNGALHRQISEWQPLWHADGLVVGGAALALALVAVVRIVRRRARVRPSLAVCTGILALATIAEARYGVWLGIAAVVLLADALPADRDAVPVRWQAIAAALAVLAFAGIAAEGAERGDARALGLMPRQAVAVGYADAVSRPSAHVLGDLNSSALLLWLHPDLQGRVDFDSRQELFRAADLERWYRFQRARGRGPVPASAADGVLIASSSWSPQLVARLARPAAGWVPVRTPDGVALARAG